MAYNKKNFYKSVILVQDKVLELKNEKEELTFEEIYWNNIYEKVANICLRTYWSYLGIPAKRELKKLLEKEEIENEDKNQYSLF